MIVEKLSDLSRYASLSENFSKAVRFLQTRDLNALPCGSVEIDGDAVYAKVMDYTLETSNQRWEAHAQYADIQVLVRGREILGWTWPANVPPTEPMNENDAAMYDGLSGIDILLQEGECIVFFPGEPHRPNVMADKQPCATRKIVVKVRM